jgi:hypothetical protein
MDPTVRLRSYQLSFVAKTAWALKRGKWLQKGVIWGLTCPEMIQFHPKTANFKIVQNCILIAGSKKPEQGNLLNQPAPFFFIYNTTPPFFFSGVSPRRRS